MLARARRVDAPGFMLVDAEDRVVEGAINLVPIGRLDALPDRPDLFISTWALNESTPVAKQEVVRRGWLGAGHLLLGMHAGHPLERAATEDRAVSEPLGPFMPAQRHLFR